MQNRQNPMPTHILPMLSVKVDEPFDKEDWLFEMKWDGFRAIAEVSGDHVNLYSRNFQSFNKRFAPIVEALKKLKIEAVFDGEIVVVNREGRSDFQALQNYQTTGVGDLRYCLFDLLYYKGKDLRSLPLIERKQFLKKIISKGKNSFLHYSDHVLRQGKKLFEAAKKEQLEGIMAKNIHSPYVSERTRQWLKIKTGTRQEAVICGYTEPKGSRQKFGSLVLGIYEKDKLIYIGHVGTGFDEKTLHDVLNRLEPYVTMKCPFAEIPKIRSKPTWVKPKILCEVSFSEWTNEKIMRHPVFLGIRTDKSPQEVHQEWNPF
jgi:bifunctional non-homologous end joining protein LigD